MRPGICLLVLAAIPMGMYLPMMPAVIVAVPLSIATAYLDLWWKGRHR